MAALQKQPLSIVFNKGLNQKTDPFQLALDNFTAMQNSVFDKAGRLTKRNGFSNLTNLPDANQTTLSTLNNNLLATGSNLYSYNSDNNIWYNKGSIQPVQLAVQPIVRASTSQTSQDTMAASNGLAFTVYVDSGASYIQISDSATGQQIIPRISVLTVDATASSTASPRVFLLGNYAIVMYLATISATVHLRYIAIPLSNPSVTLTAINLSSVVRTSGGYDAAVIGNSIYYAWAGSTSSVLANQMNSFLTQNSPITVSNSKSATLMSVSIDNSVPSAPTIWITYYDGSTSNAYTSAYDISLTITLLASTKTIDTVTVNQITSLTNSGTCTIYYEVANNYNSTGAYPNTVKTDYVSKQAVTTAGLSGSAVVMLRSVGLASKAFLLNSITYMFVVYDSLVASGSVPSNEPTLFLVNSSGAILMRLAATNAGGYVTGQVLPNVSNVNGSLFVPYLIKDFLAVVNKTTPIPAGNINAIYTQTGINLATFTINNSNQYSSEIAGALHLTGGQLWEYDGVKPVEHNFQVFPENAASGTSASSGGINIAQDYYYSFTYEWTDNAGNLHRSAPSIPIKQTTTGTTSTNTLYVPTLRLTYKISPNPVRIVGYRWSTAQQVYYQFTSLTSPTINDVTVDYVTITDANADTAILGQTILYTTGGVVEDIAAPASVASALFKNRLFLVDAEDRNLLWYSKQVIEAVPVEMSDLFTIYVAPTSGAQGSTGPTTALSAMDDKLIIFKSDAIYYLPGTGPDNTGANNDFSDPIYITSSVGCANPNSIVLMPSGIMFQSDKGIWLLGRDLQTSYIGAPVENYNSSIIKSATSIPGTNQIRFILDSGITLMYDYYFGQWATFSTLFAISATLYNAKHTYLNKFGQVYQEAQGTYLDGTTPVLMSFTTAWINLAGLQGYERFYSMNLLGTYFTPFTLQVQIAYDYNIASSEVINMLPDNYTPNWGGDSLWGGSGQWGGQSNVLSERGFPAKQKCESFQVNINEVYDPSLGQQAGQGLSLSGLLLLIGIKRGSRTQSAAKSFG